MFYLNHNIIPFSQRQKQPPKRKTKRASTAIYTGQIHSKTEKSKAKILELYKKYFQPKIGRKIKKNIQLGPKKKTTTTFLKKVDTRGQTKTLN